jgi:hypothetical protein
LAQAHFAYQTIQSKIHIHINVPSIVCAPRLSTKMYS